jgi:hypothetical protein
MISSVQTNVHYIYACVARDFDLRCFFRNSRIASPCSRVELATSCFAKSALSEAASSHVNPTCQKPRFFCISAANKGFLKDEAFTNLKVEQETPR